MTHARPAAPLTRTGWRPLALALPVALVVLTAACGSDDEAAPAAAGTSSAPAAPSSAPSTATSSSAAAPAGAVPMLMGVLGPGDAYVIGLTDSTGAKVTTLPAGKYQVMVTDPSAIHNFHLSGPGVDQETTVPEKTDVTWDVTLAAGTYTYECDPHRKMVGTFTVT